MAETQKLNALMALWPLLSKEQQTALVRVVASMFLAGAETGPAGGAAGPDGASDAVAALEAVSSVLGQAATLQRSLGASELRVGKDLPPADESRYVATDTTSATSSGEMTTEGKE